MEFMLNMLTIDLMTYQSDDLKKFRSSSLSLQGMEKGTSIQKGFWYQTDLLALAIAQAQDSARVTKY